MRHCPFCETPIHANLFSCIKCWKSLDAVQRTRIFNAQRSRWREDISLEEQRAIQAEVIEQVKARVAHV